MTYVQIDAPCAVRAFHFDGGRARVGSRSGSTSRQYQRAGQFFELLGFVGVLEFEFVKFRFLEFRLVQFGVRCAEFKRVAGHLRAAAATAADTPSVAHATA